MSTEELLIAIARVLGSLPVLRWAFAGGVLALLVDLSDLFMMNLLSLGGVSSYQALDKWLDQVYMACFLVVALRWPDPARSVAAGLYGVRLLGFLAFEATGAREVLVAFPNLFEFWFLFVAYLSPVPVRADRSPVSDGTPEGSSVEAPGARVIGKRTLLRRRFEFSGKNVSATLLTLLVLKEVQEVSLHWLKVFDSFTAVEAVEAVWEWLTGPFA